MMHISPSGMPIMPRHPAAARSVSKLKINATLYIVKKYLEINLQNLLTIKTYLDIMQIVKRYLDNAPNKQGGYEMTREEFYGMYESHINDSPRKIELRDGYEVNYTNGDVYKYQEILKPGRTPSSWSGSYFADDFEYRCYWNSEPITA